MKQIFTAIELEQLVRNRFEPPEWAFLPQVRSGTGNQRDIRTADIVIMELYPSRGLYLNGFEIKVYRGDWINELNNPEKAEAVARYCDFWWIVAPKDVVKVEELPRSWGLMNPSGKSVKIIKQAEQLKSEPIDRIFLAAILRRAQEVITPEVKIRAAFKNGLADGEKRGNENVAFEKTKYELLKAEVDKFQQASGVNIKHYWHYPDKIGEAVRQVLDGEHVVIKEKVEGLLKTAEDIVAGIKESLSRK